ncbi:hypothetical protein C8D90_106167 [Enterobacillus tribolii]|uniref:Uncharacterized protein n=1 Tax=Enterobacillus tribolii TaxID=1487935 RepID=A0A370QNL6_9GAMM|nr:hypothetical protein C8D90_106167 [Enterobacillus tribolii]
MWFCIALGFASLFVFRENLRDLFILNSILIFSGVLSWCFRGKLKKYKIHFVNKGVLPPKKKKITDLTERVSMCYDYQWG